MILRNGTGIFANEAAEKAGIAKAVLWRMGVAGETIDGQAGPVPR